jgi:hypothetical protein
MIYFIAQTVTFASLAGAIFTSSQSSSSSDLLPKNNREYLAKWWADPSTQSSKITLNQKNIDEEDQIYASSVSARASSAGTMDDEDPSFVEIGYYSDSACKAKWSSRGYMLNECIMYEEYGYSFMYELYGSKKRKVAQSVWNNGFGCWV